MQTITEQIEITPLNMDLDPCKPSEAFYQLEEYHTKTTKILTVGSIRKYKSRNSFEFNVVTDYMRLFCHWDIDAFWESKLFHFNMHIYQAIANF